MRLIGSGSSRIVLDNTYVSRKSRAGVIETASRHGLPVRCLYSSTTVEDAQVNAVSRIVSRYGRLLEPDEIQTISKRDVAAFGPAVQFGFSASSSRPIPRKDFARSSRAVRALSATPRSPTGPCFSGATGCCAAADPAAARLARPTMSRCLPDRREVLQRYAADGWRLLGLSWQPEIADKTMSVAEVHAGFARMQELLGVAIEVEYCPHAGGPPICWCRKPLPGLGVVFIHRHRLDPRSAFTSAPGRRIPALRGGSASSTAAPTSSLAVDLDPPPASRSGRDDIATASRAPCGSDSRDRRRVRVRRWAGEGDAHPRHRRPSRQSP